MNDPMIRQGIDTEIETAFLAGYHHALKSQLPFIELLIELQKALGIIDSVMTLIDSDCTFNYLAGNSILFRDRLSQSLGKIESITQGKETDPIINNLKQRFIETLYGLDDIIKRKNRGEKIKALFPAEYRNSINRDIQLWTTNLSQLGRPPGLSEKTFQLGKRLFEGQENGLSATQVINNEEKRIKSLPNTDRLEWEVQFLDDLIVKDTTHKRKNYADGIKKQYRKKRLSKRGGVIASYPNSIE